MASGPITTKKYPMGSPQEHIVTCKIHDLPIDMMCEDCAEFICSECAKTDHKDHNWKTLTTAATQRRRALLRYLKKIKEEDLPGIDENTEKMSKQITENRELCNSEIKKLEMHTDELMTRLTEMKKRHEKNLRDHLDRKNDQLNHVKSELDKKRRRIADMVEFMEENNSTMSDYSFIDNHRELTKMLFDLDVHMTNCEHSVRFTRGEINDDILDSLVGKALDLDEIAVTQINSFQYNEDTLIFMLEAFSEDKCYIADAQPEYVEEVNKEGAKENKLKINPNDICVTDNCDVFFTSNKKSINCLSSSGSISRVVSTDPLVPIGICQSVGGGLLVALTEKKSDHDRYKLNLNSRRLVRHITVTGDVIHEYEYHEDGHTRLFTLPDRVTQNSNSDICVVNSTGRSTGELVMMSPSGRMKSIYRGQNLTEEFWPTDVVCDSLCNILVTDPPNNQIHLLSFNGEFLRFLLSENEMIYPTSLSLYRSTLWVGCGIKGVVKVFQYSVEYR